MNRLTRFDRLRRTCGITITEVLVSCGILSSVLLALVSGTSMLQQQFAASTTYADSQTEQLRVMDFIERDLRRAMEVTVANGATPLTITLPGYYQTVSDITQPRLPTKSGSVVSYGGSNITVTYSLQGTRLIRTEGGVATEIASNVQTFPTPVRTNSPSRVSVTLSFNYKMLLKGTSDTITLSSNTLLRNLK